MRRKVMEKEFKIGNLLTFSLNKKRITAAFILAAAAVAFGMLYYSTAKFVVAIAFIFIAGGFFELHINGRASGLVWIPVAFAMGIFSIVITQMASDLYQPLPAVRELLMGTYVMFFMMFILFAVLLICGLNVEKSSKTAIIAVSLMFLLLGIINYYTYDLRGKDLSPEDIFSVRTAMNVVGEYHIQMTTPIRNACCLGVAGLFWLCGLHTQGVSGGKNKKRYFVTRGLALLALVLMTFSMRAVLNTSTPWYWAQKGSQVNGLALNLAAQINNNIILEPEGYKGTWLKESEEKYGDIAAAEEDRPHIIVIMNESWTDMRVWGEFETSAPVLPAFESISENTVKGYVLNSVYGGMTPDSEYEFITGNTMAFHSPAAVPYVQFLDKDVYSLVRYLETLGYEGFYTHPCNRVNYDRDIAVPHLGFEYSMFEEDYPDSERKGVNVCDGALFDRLIEVYEEGKDEAPQFMFAVSMQNHAPFPKLSSFDEPVYLQGMDGISEELMMNEFLSCVHESDAQFRRLTEYFENEDDKVLILMYGDHQPAMAEEFGMNIRGSALESLEDNMVKYTLPFVMWANFDIQEEYVELTSLNYLSNYLLKAAGLPLSPYNSFLEDLREVIPVMNAYGYWSKAKGGWAEYDEAQGEEKAMLALYEKLQYNSMFDKKNRSEVFFATD